MSTEERFLRALRVVRVLGLLALGLIALVGAPQVASADGGCDYYVYDCVDTAGECVENLHESCPAVGECQYEHQCRPSFQYPDCPLHEYIMTCEEEEPN